MIIGDFEKLVHDCATLSGSLSGGILIEKGRRYSSNPLVGVKKSDFATSHGIRPQRPTPGDFTTHFRSLSRKRYMAGDNVLF